jgi:hypothetical protein
MKAMKKSTLVFSLALIGIIFGVQLVDLAWANPYMYESVGQAPPPPDSIPPSIKITFHQKQYTV